jgi:hypothetical protein
LNNSLSALEKEVWATLVSSRLKTGKISRSTQMRMLKKLAVVSPERANTLTELAKQRMYY